MRNGFRQQPQPNRKEKLNLIEQRLQNLEMSARINQMMTQQLMQSMKGMQEDLGRSLGILNEMQYKILAVQEASGLDLAQLNEIANGKRLKDFNEASDREDADKGFTVGTVVENNSTVILTSKTEGGPDAGIFRSRVEISRCPPDLIEAFKGREAGAKTLVKLNGVEHEVELLGIRQPPAEAAAEQTADAGADTSLAQNGSAQVAGNA